MNICMHSLSLLCFFTHQGSSNYGNKFDVVTKKSAVTLAMLSFLDGHYMQYTLVSCQSAEVPATLVM